MTSTVFTGYQTRRLRLPIGLSYPDAVKRFDQLVPEGMLYAQLLVLLNADDTGAAAFMIDHPSTPSDSFEHPDIAAVGPEPRSLESG